MIIILDFEMLEPNVYNLTISNPNAGAEQADVFVEEIGDVVNDYIDTHRKSLGIDA